MNPASFMQLVGTTFNASPKLVKCDSAIRLLQIKGRGRAEDSTYTVVDVKDSGVYEKESVNEYRQGMMNKAIDKIGALKQADYDKQVR